MGSLSAAESFCKNHTIPDERRHFFELVGMPNESHMMFDFDAFAFDGSHDDQLGVY